MSLAPASPAPASTAPTVSASTRRRLAELAAEPRGAAAAPRRARPAARRAKAGSAGARSRELEAEAELIFLGLRGETRRCSRRWSAPSRASAPGRCSACSTGWRPEDAAVWGTARSLIEWHNRHLFCGACGVADPPVPRRLGPALHAAAALEHFPRVDPVVIMLAEHDGRVLLGRQPQYPAGPLFGARRLRRAGRIDRGGGGARAARGSGDRGRATSATSPASPGRSPAS